MKTKILFLLCCLSLVACAQRMDDDNAGDDDVVDPNPDPDACDSDADCVPIDGCSAAACVAGACSSEPACGAGQACDEDRNACVDVVLPPTGSGTIVCAEVAGYVDVTVSGGILDHLLVAPATSPTASWKLVYGSNPGDWEVPYASGSAKDWKAWTTDGASYKLRLPNTVTSFNIALTNGTDGSSEYWLDLNEYVVSGSTCAHVTDGGSVTRTVTASGNGTISCAESGNYVNVTISGGILAHLFSTVTPSASWKIVYGSNPGSWQVPYASGSTKDWKAWSTDGASYLLQLPNDVTLFNFALTDGTNQYWFDLNEFNVSGSTCAHVTDGGGITRTAASVSAYGTLRCEMTSETGSLKRKVTITPNVGRDIRDALIESPSPLPSPSVIQYGGSDGWTLPYASGSPKPQLSWTSGTATYTFYLDPAVDDFNFFVVDNDDPSDGWNGGDFFNLDRWSISNVGSAGCNRVGGGISIN